MAQASQSIRTLQILQILQEKQILSLSLSLPLPLSLFSLSLSPSVPLSLSVCLFLFLSLFLFFSPPLSLSLFHLPLSLSLSALRKFREGPPGSIQNVLTVLVFWSRGGDWCRAPSFIYKPQIVAPTSSCCMSPWTFVWICRPQLPH